MVTYCGVILDDTTMLSLFHKRELFRPLWTPKSDTQRPAVQALDKNALPEVLCLCYGSGRRTMQERRYTQTHVEIMEV